MPDIYNILKELMPIASGSGDEEELERKLVDMLKQSSGADEAYVFHAYKPQQSIPQIDEYVINTRIAYLDNQLSEFSAFPELVEYKAKGFKSCMVIPAIANGRVAITARLLSKKDSAFNLETAQILQPVLSFFAFSFLYKSEASKNSLIARYFDAIFNQDAIEMLVANDGAIIKANNKSMRILNATEGKKLSSIFNVPEAFLQSGEDANAIELASNMLYHISQRKISDGLISIHAESIMPQAMLSSLLAVAELSKDVYIVFADNDLSIIEASANLAERLGYAKDMFIGKKITSFFKFDIDASKGLPEGIVPAYFLDKMQPIEMAVSHASFGHCLLISNAEAKFAARVATENLNDFIESSSDIVLIIDKDGTISRCNMPISILGYAKDELIGKPATLLYKDYSILYRDMGYAMNTGKVDNSYIFLFKKSGELLPATESVRFIGPSNSYIVVIKELETKRKLAEAETELKRKENKINQQKAISEMKSQFIYNISHELKTPLTSIKGFSSLLLEGQAGSMNDMQKDYINTIINESDRLLLIIQQVLDATKLEAQKIKIELKELNLRMLSESSSIKALEEAAKRKGLSFEWNVEYDVPNIIADPNRIMQVFVNLIGNAIKFTEKGGITVHIFKKSKKTVECDVIDTGIGISDEDKRKMFKEFYQAPKHGLIKQDGAGTGLGLAITKSIVNLHHGRIFVESKLGSGSKFGFILPISPPKKKDKEKA
ncbi:MAG: PAS domain-containing sensor histidine kinase [Candidatus Micrarchaeaceae archaeon]